MGRVHKGLLPGQVIWAESSAGSTSPQLLYQAIGAGNDVCRAGAVPGWLDAGGASPPVLAFARHGLSAAACMSDAAALRLQGGMAMPGEPAR